MNAIRSTNSFTQARRVYSFRNHPRKVVFHWGGAYRLLVINQNIIGFSNDRDSLFRRISFPYARHYLHIVHVSETEKDG